MILSSFYNSEKKVLLLTTTIPVKEKKVIEDENAIKIYNEEDVLVAVNILNYENDSLLDGIVNHSQIKDVINKYYSEDIFSPYIVGEILSLKKHPKSEKLNICQVNLGNKEEQIVCGAFNVKEGIKVIVSRVGATMPSGMQIKKSKLLDEDSNGMITSLYELGLSDEASKGIQILDQTYEVGQPYER